MIEAMKQALEFFESGNFVYPTKIATDLRQAIAELESQEPVCPDCKAKVLYECVACSSNNYPPQLEQNFCPRCGKRTNDIHTCTPPQRSESSGKPSAWVGLTNEELTDLFYNTNLGQQSAVAQAIALLKEKNT